MHIHMYAHIHLYVYLHTRTHIYIRIQVEEAVDRRAVTVELSEFAAMNLSEFAAKKTPIFLEKLGLFFRGFPLALGSTLGNHPRRKTPPGGEGFFRSTHIHVNIHTHKDVILFTHTHTHTHGYIHIQVEEAMDRREVTVEPSEFAAYRESWKSRSSGDFGGDTIDTGDVARYSWYSETQTQFASVRYLCGCVRESCGCVCACVFVSVCVHMYVCVCIYVCTCVYTNL